MNRAICSTIVFLAAVFASPASAAQLVLDAQADGALGAGCRNAEIEIAPEAPAADSPRTHSLEIPGRATLQLQAGAWRITPGAGCWAPVGRIEVGEGAPAQLDLRFRAFGALAGTFKDRACPAGALAARLFSRGRGAAPPDLVAERSCRCETQGRWLCEVPAGRWDLRLSAPERAGAYLWDLAIEPAATAPAGSVELKPGASATGFVVAARGRTLPTATRVTISPVGLEPSTARAPSRAGEVLSQNTAPDDQGFFQFGSLAPGSYAVSATAPDHAVVQVAIEVSEGREFRLQQPLELSPPATLTLFLDPAVDTGGRPWQISLIEVDARSSTGREVARTVADGSGTAELGGLQPTAHLVRVADGDGNKVSGQTLELSLGHNMHSLELSLIAVEGRVTVGGEPLAATIYYGTSVGSERVTVRSDPEGAYEAVLPREGPWRIEVESEDPAVRRRLEKVVEKGRGGRPARVDLELPATRLFGRVVDSEGRELPRALVTVVPVGESQDNFVQTRAAAPDGFELLGLAAGVYQLEAETRTASSPSYTISLDESLEREVVLRVEEFVPLRGIVRLDGQPAAGAWVNLWPVQRAMGGGELFTDAQGRFTEERLGAGTREVFTTVAVPGRLLWVGRLAVEPGREMLVDLSSAAGDLRIELPEGGWSRMNDWKPVILSNGVPLPYFALDRWATLGGSPDNGPGRLVARGVTPGVYRACRVPNGEVLPAIQGGGGKLRCDEGHLAPGGSLQLTLPKGEGGEKAGTGG